VNNRLQVSIENSWEEQPKKTGGGIGLQNLQRRLQHYYGADGSWSVTAANGVYLFRLTCTLA
jgi:sensor histidine kinase YesM